MHLLADPDPTRARLLRAGLALLAERGYRGATTREIARRAGVNEVTLFRHFGGKDALLRAALQQLSPPVPRLVPPPSVDVAADLRALARNYLRLIEENQGFILRLLPELLRHRPLRGDRPPAGFARTLDAVVAFFRAHQAQGRLADGESPAQMALAFLGPLVARLLLGEAMGVHLPLDVPRYVRGYLQGRAGAAGARAPGRRRARTGV
jgi:AcrR family transcriptional regulator